ncbi:MAG: 3-deoxy-D-manno-octulosonic acid transferase [Cyclobacteriaceae bacterium]|nr:3-deoxy-D-manno-octulosonic acid transferase [Cyclobacteriaceae bacterium]
MSFLYSSAITLIRLLFSLAAFFNPKARLFVDGRKRLFQKLESTLATNNQPLVWVHCASLGEFEQGRPIMEAFKKQFPHYKILLTFFSPSGYEVRKNYTGADYIFYLPWDTATNAKRFIKIVNPALAIFIKYEFWYQYSKELSNRNIPIISASCIFRPNQAFFKWYGPFFRAILKNFTHFFVQSKQSIELLKQIGIEKATLAGDTRFDRVHDMTQQARDIDLAAQFKDGDKLFVVGSLWPEDLEVLAIFINENKNSLKFIIAPHEINEKFLKEIESAIHVKSVRFSKTGQHLNTYNALIIDNVGMLSSLYRYGEFAFVGGAYGKGLHNILEAACYGVPIFFGNKNYEKFQEAKELIMRGGAFTVADYSELKANYELMISRPENYLLACEVTKSYVIENLGATKKIMDYCHKLLTA